MGTQQEKTEQVPYTVSLNRSSGKQHNENNCDEERDFSKFPEKDTRWWSCLITKKQDAIRYLFCDVTYWADTRRSLCVAVYINLGKFLFLGRFLANN